MSSPVTVSFSVSVNDGGKGHAQTFTLEELGIDPNQTEDELEEELQTAYEQWVWNLNTGGWGYD